VIGTASTRQHRGYPPLRRLLLISAAVLLPVLAGCEAGNNAPTLGFHPPTDAATAQAGNLSIQNVFVLGAPLGASLHKGQTASLFFSVVTTGGPDRLLSVTAPGSATSVQLPGGSVAVGPSHPVLLNGPKTQAYLVGLTRNITGGSVLTLTLNFQKEGAVTLHVPVVARAAHYVTYGPPPASPSAVTATTTARKHHKAPVSPTPSGTPTPSVSPTPTPSTT
jgi:copper(I)-binding protein